MHQAQVFFGDWELADWQGRIGKDQLEADFAVKLEDSIEIIFAWYSYENYYGRAYVLFAQDGKLFEVTGSHCSCYGLEDQWEPEEVSVDDATQTLMTSTYEIEDADARKAGIGLLHDWVVRQLKAAS